MAWVLLVNFTKNFRILAWVLLVNLTKNANFFRASRESCRGGFYSFPKFSESDRGVLLWGGIFKSTVLYLLSKFAGFEFPVLIH